MKANEEVCLKVSKDKGEKAYKLLEMLYAWKEQANKLSAGEISKDDYDRWRLLLSEIRYHAVLGESAFAGVERYAGGGVSGQTQKKMNKNDKKPLAMESLPTAKGFLIWISFAIQAAFYHSVTR